MKYAKLIRDTCPIIAHHLYLKKTPEAIAVLTLLWTLLDATTNERNVVEMRVLGFLGYAIGEADTQDGGKLHALRTQITKLQELAANAHARDEKLDALLDELQQTKRKE